MAATVTLAQLRERSRLYADERPEGTDTYLTKVEMTSLVNQSIKELYDRLVAARGHEYYAAFANFNTAAGTASYNLPADHYETLKVTLQWSATDLERVEDGEIEDIDDLNRLSTWGRWSPKMYRNISTVMFLSPTPTTVVAVDHMYVPTFTDLVQDADTFDGVNGWEKSVALRTAIEIRTIQQEDTGDLKELLAAELVRIDGLAADRAARAPKRVRDVMPENSLRRWPERLPRP